MKLSEVALKSKKTLKYSQKKFTNYYYMPQDREYWPMTLKDHVTRNIDKDKKIYCLGEMSVLIACLQKYDFNDRECAKEVGKFYSCVEKFKLELAEKKEAEKAGVVKIKKHGKPPLQLVNKLLAMYPHPKS